METHRKCQGQIDTTFRDAYGRHQCHEKEFLLKFEKDRQRWRHWLYEAKKRYNLCILNYIITSNHIHLLVLDTKKDVIPKSLQLVANRTAQEFNKRKSILQYSFQG